MRVFPCYLLDQIQFRLDNFLTLFFNKRTYAVVSYLRHHQSDHHLHTRVIHVINQYVSEFTLNVIFDKVEP